MAKDYGFDFGKLSEKIEQMADKIAKDGDRVEKIAEQTGGEIGDALIRGIEDELSDFSSRITASSIQFEKGFKRLATKLKSQKEHLATSIGGKDIVIDVDFSNIDLDSKDFKDKVNNAFKNFKINNPIEFDTKASETQLKNVLQLYMKYGDKLNQLQNQAPKLKGADSLIKNMQEQMALNDAMHKIQDMLNKSAGMHIDLPMVYMESNRELSKNIALLQQAGKSEEMVTKKRNDNITKLKAEKKELEEKNKILEEEKKILAEKAALVKDEPKTPAKKTRGRKPKVEDVNAKRAAIGVEMQTFALELESLQKEFGDTAKWLNQFNVLMGQIQQGTLTAAEAVMKLREETSKLNNISQAKKTQSLLFHNSNEIFDEFDSSRVSRQGKTLGPGNYLSLKQDSKYNTLDFGRYQTQWYADIEKVFDNQNDVLSSDEITSILDKYLPELKDKLDFQTKNFIQGYTAHAIKSVAQKANVPVLDIWSSLGYDAIKDKDQINVFDSSKIHRANDTVFDVKSNEFKTDKTIFNELQSNHDISNTQQEINSQEELQKEIEKTNRIIKVQKEWLDYLDPVLNDVNFKTSGKKEATEQLRTNTNNLINFRQHPAEYDGRAMYQEKVELAQAKAYKEAERQGVAQSTLNRHYTDAIHMHDVNLKKLQKERELHTQILSDAEKELVILEQQLQVVSDKSHETESSQTSLLPEEELRVVPHKKKLRRPKQRSVSKEKFEQTKLDVDGTEPTIEVKVEVKPDEPAKAVEEAVKKGRKPAVEVDVTGFAFNDPEKLAAQMSKFADERSKQDGYDMSKVSVRTDKNDNVRDAQIAYYNKKNNTTIIESYIRDAAAAEQGINRLVPGLKKITVGYSDFDKAILSATNKQNNFAIGTEKTIGTMERVLDVNANRTLSGKDGANEVKSKFEEIKALTDKLKQDPNGILDPLPEREFLATKKRIGELINETRKFIQEKKDAVYGPTQLESHSVESGNKYREDTLMAKKAKWKQQGIYGGELKAKTEELLGSVDTVKDHDDLRTYLEGMKEARALADLATQAKKKEKSEMESLVKLQNERNKIAKQLAALDSSDTNQKTELILQMRSAQSDYNKALAGATEEQKRELQIIQEKHRAQINLTQAANKDKENEAQKKRAETAAAARNKQEQSYSDWWNKALHEREQQEKVKDERIIEARKKKEAAYEAWWQKQFKLQDIAEQKKADKPYVDYGKTTANAALRKQDQLQGQYDSLEVTNPNMIAQMESYKKKVQEVINLRNQFANDPNAAKDPTLVKQFQKVSYEAEQARKNIKSVLDEETMYAKMSDEQGLETRDLLPGQIAKDQMLQLAKETEGGRVQIKGFNADYTKLNYTVTNAKGTVQEMTIALGQGTNTMYQYRTATKETGTAFDRFMKGISTKAKEISTFILGGGSIYKLISIGREGIRVVRDIDLALTELKKVTDETEETYDKFLDTASKTAAKVGSTIKDVISSTADWARLGYSMEQSAKFAESTQILMNVSEFTDVSRATDTLISSVQAFGYTAETSMEVVDLLNTIGNNYAISTADLASSLTKSSASLVAAGGDLAEAAALTATANAIIQDADSVGTALKTTSLRLRGTDAKVLEEEGLDSEGAVASKSKLQSKVKAISGVDILTQSGEYKSTYEILSQIAEVWEDISDIDQAALLELISGKRNSSVIAAILQSPEALKAAYEDAQNAAGSAAEENAKYMDSIQGRIDQFNNALQTMWANLLDDDVVKFFVDLGRQLVVLLDKIGPLNALFIGFGIFAAKKYNLLDNLFGKPESIEKSIEKLQQQRAKLDGLTGTNAANQRDEIDLQIREKQAILDQKTATEQKTAATWKDLAVQIISGKVTKENIKENIKNVLVTKLTNSALGEKVAAHYGVQVAELGTLTITQLLTGGFTALADAIWTALAPLLPFIAAAAAIAGVVALAVVAIDHFWVTAGEAKEKLEGLNSEIDSLKTELDSLNSELETTQERMEELLSKDSLSFTEQEELNNLKLQNEQLERQIELQKLILDNKEKARLSTAQDVIGKTWDSKSYGKEDYQVDVDDGVIKKDGFWSFGRSGKNAIDKGLTEYQKTQEKYNAAYDEYIKALNSGADSDKLEKLKKKYEKYADRSTKQEGGIAMVLSEMSDIITENELQYGQSDEINKFLDEYHAMTLKWQEAQGLSGKSDIIKSIFSNAAPEGIQQLKKQLDEIANSGEDSAIKQSKAQELIQNALDSTDKDYQRLNTTMSTLGMTADELAESFIAVSNAPDISTIGGVLEVFADGEEILQNYQKHLEEVKVAETEMTKLQAGGSVDLLNRPQIKTADMMKAFYSQDKYAENLARELEGVTDQDLSTVWTQTFSNTDFGLSGPEIAMNFTPIMPDGQVMEKNAFEDYVAGVLGGAEDTLQLKIGATFEGENAIDEAVTAAEYIHELQEDFYNPMLLGTDEAGETITFDNLFKEVDGEKVADNLKVAAILEGADEDVRNKFGSLLEDVENRKKSIEQAMSEWEIAGIDKMTDALNEKFESLNTELFPDAKDEISGLIDTLGELKTAFESVAKIMDVYKTAQEEMNEGGRVSIETALELMSHTSDWNSILEITNGQIKLRAGSEEELMAAQLKSIKEQTKKSAELAAAKLAAAKEAQAAKEAYDAEMKAANGLADAEDNVAATQNSANAVTNKKTQQMGGLQNQTNNTAQSEINYANNDKAVVSAEGAKAKAIGLVSAMIIGLDAAIQAFNEGSGLGKWGAASKAFYGAYTNAKAETLGAYDIAALQQQADATAFLDQVAGVADTPQKFGKNYSSDSVKGSDKDEKTAFETMQARHEREIAALEHQQELIQGDIDILEAQRKGISSDYYKKLIAGENKKIDAYERQLEESKALLAATSTTSEEYNEIVEHIWDIEKGLQEAALAAIEFGEALNSNHLKGITDIGDAYENLYTIIDRQKGSMDLYKEGVEIGGGYVNERWYDDMIAKAGEAGNLARQELADSLWAIDKYRNEKNPFEVGTAEYEGFEFDRNTNLQEAWQQAADAKDKIQEMENEALQLAEDKKDAYIEAWENVATGFERIGTLFENQISLIDGYESRLEALNINVSDAIYEKKIGTQKNILDNLDEQIAYDENMLAEYAAKYGTNDERYITKWEELNDKRVQRYEAETEIIQIEQQIIENQIDRFNQTIDRMNNVVDKMSNIKGLISDEDVADENGDWTAEGLIQAGMNYQEMAYQKEMVAAYAGQMEELTEAYEDGRISEKEYYEQMKELEDGQWAAIDAYKAAEDALIDLEEARIDMIEEGLQEEIDAYSELIQLKQEELDAERDLFEFRRDVEDQSKNIAEIERRIASLSGSSSDEDRAEMKRLQKELSEANRGLDDTYRNHSYDQTSQALDEELEVFEKTYEDYIQGLRDELENTDELIKRIYSDVVTNGQLVLETLVQLSDEHGFTLDENLVSPWRNANGESLDFETAASEHYLNVKRTVEDGTAGFVENIEKPWKRGQEEAKVFSEDAEKYLQAALDSAKNKKDEMSETVCQPWLDAKKLIDQGPSWVSAAAYNILQVVKQNVKDINDEYAKIKSPGAQLSGSTTGGNSNSSSGNGSTTSFGNIQPKTTNTSSGMIGKYKSSEVLSLGRGPLSEAAVDKLVKSGDVIYNAKTGDLRNATAQEKAKNKMLNPFGLTMFAKGTTGTTKDQWAITDEPQYGDELVLVPGKSGNLSFMRKGTSVVPADLTKRIMEIAQMPTSELGGNIIKAIVPNIETNTQSVQVNFEALVKAEHIDSNIMNDVEKMVEKQLNNFTRNLNYAIKKYK